MNLHITGQAFFQIGIFVETHLDFWTKRSLWKTANLLAKIFVHNNSIQIKKSPFTYEQAWAALLQATG